MKKIISITAIIAAVALVPTAASAHSKQKHHVYQHKAEEVVLLGSGVGAGAIIAGPLGAVVGGVAVLFLGHVAHVGY